MEHETRDIDARGILTFATVLTVVGMVLLVALWGLLHSWETALARTESPGMKHHKPPAPRLQINPSRDLSALRAQEDALLTTYAWVDVNAGIVRIPIADAIELLVAPTGE